jgi:hypothetical protein
VRVLEDSFKEKEKKVFFESRVIPHDLI